MPLSTRALVSVAALTACAMVPAAQAAIVYSLASSGQRLIRFDTATPGAVTNLGNISGVAGGNGLRGLDFRPANGLLYGYSDDNDSVYTVNTTTGAATLVTAISAPTNNNNLGIDFNPMADRLRIVNLAGQNLRVNVANGATTVDDALAYAASDPNSGVNPNIIDAAYTNSDTDPATGTTLYYLDYVLDTLVTTSDPNGGVLNTVGALGIDFGTTTGFDIFTQSGNNQAYGAFRVGGVNSLYTINLVTGAATLVGAIGDFSFLNGLAIAPAADPAAVPEPGSLALLGIAGLAALGASRRRHAGSGAIPGR